MCRNLWITVGIVVGGGFGAIGFGEEIPPELKTPNYRIRELTTLGRNAKIERQDPSNVIKVGDTYRETRRMVIRPS